MVFAFGLMREMLNVAWVHHTQAGHVSASMFIALVNGGVGLVGIAESLKSRWVAASFVAGDAAGTGLGTLWFLLP